MVLIIEQFNFINSFVILFLIVLIDKVVDCCICFATQQRLQMKSKVEEFFPTLETQLQVDCCDTIANPSTTHLLKPAKCVVCWVCVVDCCVLVDFATNRCMRGMKFHRASPAYCWVDCSGTFANPATMQKGKPVEYVICGMSVEDCCISTKSAIKYPITNSDSAVLICNRELDILPSSACCWNLHPHDHLIFVYSRWCGEMETASGHHHQR